MKKKHTCMIMNRQVTLHDCSACTCLHHDLQIHTIMPDRSQKSSHSPAGALRSLKIQEQSKAIFHYQKVICLFVSPSCHRALPGTTTIFCHPICGDVSPRRKPDYLRWRVVAIECYAHWQRSTGILCLASQQFTHTENDEDSEIVRTILGSIFVLQQSRPALFENIPYTIRERGGNDKRRLEIMLQTKFPEPHTIELLQDNLHDWSGDPAHFWQHPSFPHIHQLPPAARIAGCYLRARRLDA